MMIKSWSFCAAVAVLGCAPVSASANLLTNGSFEDTTNFVNNDGVFDSDLLLDGSTAMTGWTVRSGRGFGEGVQWIGPTNPFGLSAADGSYFLDLTSAHSGRPYGGVEQTIATQKGATYSLTFDLGSAEKFGIQAGIEVTAGSATDSFISTNDGRQQNLWQLESMSFTGSGPSTTIVLQGDAGLNYIGLDNVTVAPTSGAIPEPSTWAMMLLGFAGLGYAGFRRSAKVAALAHILCLTQVAAGICWRRGVRDSIHRGLIAVSVFGLLTVAAKATSYDLAAQFSGAQGIWSYGYLPPGTQTEIPFPNFVAATVSSPLEYWNNPRLSSDPLHPPVDAFNTSSTDTPLPSTVLFLPRQAAFHPGPRDQIAVYVFTAPQTGRYDLQSTFSGRDYAGPTDTQVQVVERIAPGNHDTLFTGIVNGYAGDPNRAAFGASPSITFDDTLTLTAGQSIDFEVAWDPHNTRIGGPYHNDTTAISARLTTVVPEPSTWAMMLLGFVSLGFAGFRRRREGRGLVDEIPYSNFEGRPCHPIRFSGATRQYWGTHPPLNLRARGSRRSLGMQRLVTPILVRAPNADTSPDKRPNFVRWVMKSRFAGLVAAVGLTIAASATAYAATIVVNSKDDIYAAGGNSSASAAGGIAPVDISVNGDSTLTFGATGRFVGCFGCPSGDADGVGAGGPSSNIGAGSISGISAPGSGSLVGVFVPTGGPKGLAPRSLDFTGAGGTSFTSLSPELDQVFFIGDGLTGDGTGTRQSFIAPSGASLLYLGISDSCNYSTPSCYFDNSGRFTVNVSGAVSGVPEPSTWVMMLLGFGGLAFTGSRRSKKNRFFGLGCAS